VSAARILYLAGTHDEGVRLYVGGDACTVQRRRCHLTGYRCFSGAYGPKSRFPAPLVPQVRGLLDSGAFSDSPGARLDPAGALGRQLAWEANASRLWGDEKWTRDGRKKQRWTVPEADRAVRVTVDAAAHLASQRKRLAPRTLVLACQGVDGAQYEDCVRGVLAHARPGDWLGLGGWCILGWYRSWIPTFWDAMRRVLPLAASAGLSRVHVFGVMYQPVLGGLLWLCDRLRLGLSTDSSGPILQPTWKDRVKAGAYAETWEENVAEWQRRLRTLREGAHYREPPAFRLGRQGELFASTAACATSGSASGP
jgi:hypothetical protein